MTETNMLRKMSLPTNRRPTTPGEMLVQAFLEPMGISQADFARRLNVSYVRLNEIVNGRRAVTPDTALRFARALGTTPQFWLNGQRNVDLWDVLHDKGKEIRAIKPLPHAS